MPPMRHHAASGRTEDVQDQVRRYARLTGASCDHADAEQPGAHQDNRCRFAEAVDGDARGGHDAVAVSHATCRRGCGIATSDEEVVSVKAGVPVADRGAVRIAGRGRGNVRQLCSRCARPGPRAMHGRVVTLVWDSACAACISGLMQALHMLIHSRLSPLADALVRWIDAAFVLRTLHNARGGDIESGYTTPPPA